MAGISSKALAFGDPVNKLKFQGYEHNPGLDINLYESFFRTFDSQIGRFLQIDPKPNEYESPYASFGNNPIKNVDILGDTTIIPQHGGILVSESTCQGCKAIREKISIGPVRNAKSFEDEGRCGIPFTSEGGMNGAPKGKNITDSPVNIDGLAVAFGGMAKLAGLELPIFLEVIQKTKEFAELKEGENNDKSKKEPAFIGKPPPVEIFFDGAPAIKGQTTYPMVKHDNADPTKPDTIIYSKKTKK